MNNEPVAWLWTKDGKPQSALLHEPMTLPNDPYWKDKGFKAIPLYTHPSKDLTDEEILKEWTWKYSDCFEDFLLQFAKAILGKAQEK